MYEHEQQDEERIEWIAWDAMLAAARRYEANWQTRKAIAAIKPAKKKPKVQMPGLPFVDNPKCDEEND